MDIENNPFLLQNKKFLVTGAASGIGRATAIVLSGLGSDLILADINASSLNETAALCKKNVDKIEFDFRKTDCIKDWMIDLANRFGKLDGFAHIAGIPYISPLKTLSNQTLLDVINVNTIAAVELSRSFISRQVFGGNSGSIVYISSVYGLVGSAANCGYAISKSALHGLTKSLAIELSPKKIRVNCIAPGFVKSEMMGATNLLFDDGYVEGLTKLHPLGLGEPKDVAYAVAYLFSDAAKWITGTILNVDGGFTAQ